MVGSISEPGAKSGSDIGVASVFRNGWDGQDDSVGIEVVEMEGFHGSKREKTQVMEREPPCGNELQSHF